MRLRTSTFHRNQQNREAKTLQIPIQITVITDYSFALRFHLASCGWLSLGCFPGRRRKTCKMWCEGSGEIILLELLEFSMYIPPTLEGKVFVRRNSCEGLGLPSHHLMNVALERRLFSCCLHAWNGSVVRRLLRRWQTDFISATAARNVGNVVYRFHSERCTKIP